MPSLGFVLKSGGVNGDTSGFFLGSLIDFRILDVFGMLFGCQVLGDGRSQGGFTMIDVSDGAH